jgi:hypothetical protein
MGIVTSNISSGVNGAVMSFGTLTGLDTRGDTASALAVGDETWAAGDILFAHPTVAGKLTNIKPQHDLAVAFITVRHASTGQIAIRIIPGNNHLEWMHDVVLSSPTDGQFLRYNSASTVWVNDEINLGTDTVGNYMSGLYAGSGIAISHTPGEGSTASISIESTAWTAYTPTITADGGGFALNNGTLTGRYKQVGKTVFFKLRFVYGSTTSPGSGHWNFSLPATAYDSDFTFSATILDDGAAWYGGIGNGNYTGSTSNFAVITTSPSASVATWVPVGNGGPFTWGAADNITISGSYEAA